MRAAFACLATLSMAILLRLISMPNLAAQDKAEKKAEKAGRSNDNKPGALAQVKELDFISCSGTFNAKDQFIATECIYREAK